MPGKEDHERWKRRMDTVYHGHMLLGLVVGAQQEVQYEYIDLPSQLNVQCE